ncbi:CBS domain-containing protein [Daejeonella sp.]|uniref:CBS domain-containing protein n=1 Tax=Daejeonella sp. TaxID=2805397 RepID=UPI0039831D6E
MGSVQSILKAKGGTTFSIAPDTIVYRALEIMVERNVSALVVMENDRLVGMFSEKDYARKVILKGKASKQTKIRDIMSENITTVGPSASIDECMQLMTNNFIRHLPVMQEGQLIGIISIGDVVKFIIDEQKFIIQNMEQYIGGT